jgi:hypothetical protein
MVPALFHLEESNPRTAEMADEEKEAPQEDTVVH